MKPCAVHLRTYFSDETSVCALIHMHHGMIHPVPVDKVTPVPLTEKHCL